MPRTAFPDWLDPMAATLTHERFGGPEWIFERKFDGIRLLTFRQGRKVRLLSRNRLPQQHRTHTASFTIGLPGEMEENNTFATADALPLGGYMIGTIESNDVDVYRVRISATGQYTFETAPVEGACNFALEEDTYIELYDGLGTLLAAHDDINEAAYNYCARITTTLATGTYYLAVKGRYEVGWRYALLARTP